MADEAFPAAKGPDRPEGPDGPDGITRPDDLVSPDRPTRRLRRSELRPLYGAMPERVAAYIDEAARLARGVDCFDYVPSNPATLMAHLDALPRGRFCEWGSGIGIGVAVAAALGFEAIGIELNQELVEMSRGLLERYGFAAGDVSRGAGNVSSEGRVSSEGGVSSPTRMSAEVRQGDYLVSAPVADVTFVYCWPGQASCVRARFLELAPPTACLLFGEGAERIDRYRIA